MRMVNFFFRREIQFGEGKEVSATPFADDDSDYALRNTRIPSFGGELPPAEDAPSVKKTLKNISDNYEESCRFMSDMFVLFSMLASIFSKKMAKGQSLVGTFAVLFLQIAGQSKIEYAKVVAKASVQAALVPVKASTRVVFRASLFSGKAAMHACLMCLQWLATKLFAILRLASMVAKQTVLVGAQRIGSILFKIPGFVLHSVARLTDLTRSINFPTLSLNLQDLMDAMNQQTDLELADIIQAETMLGDDDAEVSEIAFHVTDAVDWGTDGLPFCNVASVDWGAPGLIWFKVPEIDWGPAGVPY